MHFTWLHAYFVTFYCLHLFQIYSAAIGVIRRKAVFASVRSDNGTTVCAECRLSKSFKLLVIKYAVSLTSFHWQIRSGKWYYDNDLKAAWITACLANTLLTLTVTLAYDLRPWRSIHCDLWSWPYTHAKNHGKRSVGSEVKVHRKTDGRTQPMGLHYLPRWRCRFKLFKDLYRKSKRNNRRNVGKFNVLYFIERCAGIWLAAVDHFMRFAGP